jgi:ABC-type phosphate/phosphonate transport system substrate-binding protein
MTIAHAQATAGTRWRASLPMYNLPEMQAANQAFWDAIRHELQQQGVEDAPQMLDFERRPVPAAIEPDTLFTQVCGYPLQTIFRGQAVVLGAPLYAVERCEGPTHAAVFIVHRDAAFTEVKGLKGCRFVYNSRHSNSGMNLPRRVIAEIAGGAPFFGSIAETDSHPGNIERIARREADATCVDCVTYAFFCRHRPELGDLTRVLAATPATPSLPFVSALTTPDDLRAGLQAALFAVARSARWSDVRAGLMLRDIVPVEIASYAGQLRLEREAAELGYPELR